MALTSPWTLGLMLPTKLHLIICTQWQRHPVNEVPAFPESLLGLLGEVNGMSPSKPYQGNRKWLNYNSPFTAPILTNTLSKNESQKEWRKRIFHFPRIHSPMKMERRGHALQPHTSTALSKTNWFLWEGCYSQQLFPNLSFIPKPFQALHFAPLCAG